MPVLAVQSLCQASCEAILQHPPTPSCKRSDESGLAWLRGEFSSDFGTFILCNHEKRNSTEATHIQWLSDFIEVQEDLACS